MIKSKRNGKDIYYDESSNVWRYVGNNHIIHNYEQEDKSFLQKVFELFK